MDNIAKFLQFEEEYLSKLREACQSCLPEIFDFMNQDNMGTFKDGIKNDPALLAEWRKDWTEEATAAILFYNITAPLLLKALPLIHKKHKLDYIYKDPHLADWYSSTSRLDSASIFKELSKMEDPFLRRILATSITNPVIRERIEAAIANRDLEQFRNILYEFPSETEKLILISEYEYFMNYTSAPENASNGNAMRILRHYEKELLNSLYDRGEINDAERERAGNVVNNLLRDIDSLADEDPSFETLNAGAAAVMALFLHTDTFTEDEMAIIGGLLDDPATPEFGKMVNEKMKEMFGVNYKSTSGNADRTKIVIQEQQPESVEQGLHWPTDEELEGYENNFSSSEYFKESIFGVAPNIKASDVELLYNCLTNPKLKLLDDNLETKLIFLARYSGKKIPYLELKPLEWKMLNEDDRDKALGYLIKKTGKANFATGIKFFYYYDRKGDKTQFEREPVALGGNAWSLAGRQEKTKRLFETELNEFIEQYKGLYEE